MSKKVMISLPDELLADIDAAAHKERRSRSEFIREATRRYMTEQTSSKARPSDDSKVKRALEIMERMTAKSTTGWDAADAVRELRDKDKPTS